MEVELDVPATPRETWSEFFRDWREFVVEWMKCQEDHLFKVRASGRGGDSCQTCEVANALCVLLLLSLATPKLCSSVLAEPGSFSADRWRAGEGPACPLHASAG